MMTRSSGFHLTVVDGHVAFTDGEPTGALPGRLLRSTENGGH